MTLVLRIAVGVVVLFFAGLGVNFMFNPAAASAQFSITPDGAAGLNSVRGDLGGMFVAAALLLVVGLVRQQAAYILAVSVLLVSIAFGRVVGLILDGLGMSGVASPLVEVVLAVVLFVSARRMNAEQVGSAGGTPR